MATAIVLNGTSSSGKTTVARAFQEIAPRLFLNFSIDSILYALPQSAIDRVIRGDDLSDLRLPELIRAFYACVRQLLDLGHDLVIDHAVTARYHAELLLEALESHDALSSDSIVLRRFCTSVNSFAAIGAPAWLSSS